MVLGIIIEIIAICIGLALGGITGAIIAWMAWEIIATIIFNHS